MENGSAAAQLADRFWEELLEVDPLIGTEVGDERFDDRLPDPTESGLAREQQVYRRALDALPAVDRGALGVTERTTLAVMEAIARRRLSWIEHRMDRFQAVTHLWGPGSLLADLGSVQRADTPERLDRYVARLRAVPAYLEALGQVAEEAAGVGQTVPTVVVERTIAQVKRLLNTSPEDSSALQPVPPSAPEGRARVAEALREDVWPAYREYLETLRRYRPFATETIGLSALQGGEGMYASQILAWTTLPLEAQRVHDLGREQLEAIYEERREIARALGHEDPDEALREYEASGRDRASSREEMIRLIRDQVERGWEAAPGWFGRLPEGNCDVRPVEEFREADMPGAFYLPPTADNSRKGIYYVNTSDLDQRPLHHTATTTYHEANPGHHFQISIEQEYVERPPLRRFGGGYVGSSFTEGWGLYSERLADEMGLFLDEYERLGMLEAQALRAARLVVDTGIHALGWDRERSVRQMQETGAPRVDSEIEVDRYIATPGQALAYMIGQLEIQKWRKAASDREGEAFSLRDFHDRLLGLGSLPLPVLERELEGALGNGKAG